MVTTTVDTKTTFTVSEECGQADPESPPAQSEKYGLVDPEITSTRGESMLRSIPESP